MADEDELYLENLDEFVNDGDKIVTYKWLSRTLSVPVNWAKQMLYAFVQKQKALKSASHLNITYVIGGRYIVDGDTVHRYVVTNDKDLQETKKTFSVVTSLHIYSVQKCKLKDSNSLYTIDYDIQQQHKTEPNRWSHICCPSAKRLAGDGAHRARAAQNVNGIAYEDKRCSSSKMVNGESSSSHTIKGPSTLEKGQKSKASDAKTKKGQISALEMFAAKPSTSKTEKSNDKNEGDTREDKDESKAAQTKSDSKAGGMKSFFGQNKTVKKVSEKQETMDSEKAATVRGKSQTTIPQKQTQTAESKQSKKRELSSEDEEEPLPPKLSKTFKSHTKEDKVLKESKKKVQKKEDDKNAEESKSTKAGKKKAVLSDSDEEPEEKPKKKRRKRMKELPEEDSSGDEEAMTNGESDKKLSSDKSDSPLPQQQALPTENDTGRRRKRKRELKSKTYMNDEGFMVTEKVWESESTDASDNDVQITTEPQMEEKRPSPAKKSTKKTHADIKNKGTKQASLTSFFYQEALMK